MTPKKVIEKTQHEFRTSEKAEVNPNKGNFCNELKCAIEARLNRPLVSQTPKPFKKIQRNLSIYTNQKKKLQTPLRLAIQKRRNDSKILSDETNQPSLPTENLTNNSNSQLNYVELMQAIKSRRRSSGRFSDCAQVNLNDNESAKAALECRTLRTLSSDVKRAIHGRRVSLQPLTQAPELLTNSVSQIEALSFQQSVDAFAFAMIKNEVCICMV